MAGGSGGQNRPDGSARTSDGSMDTRSSTPDLAAEKTRKHPERAGDGKGKGHAPGAAVSGEAAGALKDQVGKSG